MKRRDAGTGQYISEKQAESQDPNTWITEIVDNNRQKLLKELYRDILIYAGYSECEDFESVKVENITKVFKEAGLEL